jgi:hypothetical protein
MLFSAALLAMLAGCQPSGKTLPMGLSRLDEPARGAAPPYVLAGDVQEITRHSDIVFTGTVQKVGVTSFRQVPQSSRNMIVRVDAIHEKPAAVTLRVGDHVTVLARDPVPFTKGTRAIWYTNGWVFGKGVAVREVSHQISTGPAHAAMMQDRSADLRRVRRDLATAQLKRRIDSADVVVVGRVLTVGSDTMAAAAGQPAQMDRPISEHDPQWQEAVIVVESAVKGARAGDEIVVRFPASMDVVWFRAPKFQVGQAGTFILSRDRISGATQAVRPDGQKVDAFTALSAQDVLSQTEERRVREALRE